MLLNQIVKALRLNGYDVAYMVKYDEGRNFAREENQLELNSIMMGFFTKHLEIDF